MLLGYARGKVGSLVFSRSNGQQITRMRASKVKNPQTDAQVVQRIILNTVAQAYSALQPICDHSFEGVKKGQDAMSMFMRTNINELRTKVAEELEKPVSEYAQVADFTPINASKLAITNYVIAKGSLPAVTANNDEFDSRYINITPGNFTLGYTLANASDQGVADNAELTYQNIIDTLGLKRGDQLTFVVLVVDGNKNTSAKWMRIILDPKNEDGSDAPLSTVLTDQFDRQTAAINKANPENVVPEGMGLYVVVPQYNAIKGYSVGVALDAFTVLGSAVIVSRQKADGTWARSNAAIECITGINVNNADTPKYVRTTIEQALSDFRSKGINLASEYYLNNATD